MTHPGFHRRIDRRDVLDGAPTRSEIGGRDDEQPVEPFIGCRQCLRPVIIARPRLVGVGRRFGGARDRDDVMAAARLQLPHRLRPQLPLAPLTPIFIAVASHP